MDVFIILQLSGSVRFSRKWFSGDNKERKQHYYIKRKQIRCLNIFNIINILTLLSADAKWAILLRVLSLTKVEVHNFLLLHFSRWFCLVNGQLSMSLRGVKRSVICKFQCFCPFVFNNYQFYLKYYFLHHRKEIQLNVNCYIAFLIFYQNAKTIAVPYIYSTWRNLPKPS